ncbi:SUKH-3 domain-containing protein [Chryseobacterium sp. RU33C]|uniref:SUKH-3 domain-containing protein n=1 Tax=Chryseobacterium sp. RU33C TaxID=1907398 RepID=UPI0009556DDF|nr:SUKH-3 domain-containing protein [Chryseobacterium sp. RU33C]SIQ27116.1 SUKH-3 immunity protein [Chryseobacterium sp. RU33C]
MKFKKEVQKYFENSGWFEGRNVKSKFDKIKGFENFPQFLKDFLYEYGDLEVETHKYNKNDVTGIMNFKALTKGIYKIDGFLKNPRYYGNTFTFPIAYYLLDNAGLECDADGKVYMSGDFPCLVSDDFKTGIEKVIMEDYSDTFGWNPEIQMWEKDY